MGRANCRPPWVLWKRSTWRTTWTRCVSTLTLWPTTIRSLASPCWAPRWQRCALPKIWMTSGIDCRRRVWPRRYQKPARVRLEVAWQFQRAPLLPHTGPLRQKQTNERMAVHIGFWCCPFLRNGQSMEVCALCNDIADPSVSYRHRTCGHLSHAKCLNAPGVVRDFYKCGRVACGGTLVAKSVVSATASTTVEEEPRPADMKDWVLAPGPNQDRTGGPSTVSWLSSKVGLVRETPLEQCSDPYRLLQHGV